MQTYAGKRYFQGRQFKTLMEMYRQNVELYGDLFAYRFHRTPDGPEETRTYRKFVQDIEAFGTALVGMGLKGGHIAVIGENRYEWAVAHTAVINGVGVSVPLDRMLPVNEVADLLVRGEAVAMVFAPKFLGMMKTVAAGNAMIRHFIIMGPPEGDETLPDDPRFIRMEPLLETGAKALAEGDRRFVDAEIDTEAMCSLLFTSGTTAMSKGVMLNQRNICSNVYSVSGVIKIEPAENALSVLPLHHTFENTVGMYMMHYYGCCVCFTDGLRYFSRNLAEWKIDILLAVPLLFENVYAKIQENIRKSGKEKLVGIMRKVARGLLKVGIDVRRKLFHQILEGMGGHLRLCVSGAAPIDPKTIQAFLDFGVLFLQGYGLTETSPVATACNEKVNIVGSIGHPVSEVEVAIDTDSGEPGAIGEILVRGPNVMMGYYKNPEATADVMMPDGWFRTGDMGYLDRHHCIHITGRVKSMIVLANGKKAFPEEIETVLNREAGIKESMAWGDKNPFNTVDICARILPDRDRLAELGIDPEDDKAVSAHLEERIKSANALMPEYRAVKYFVYSYEDMIKTTTLKIKRPAETERILGKVRGAGLIMRSANGRNLDRLGTTG